MTLIFIVVCTLLILWQRYREKNWVNLVSILIAPYVVIVGLNNYVITKLGFFKIDDRVLLMLLSAFILFFIGGLPFNVGKINYAKREDLNPEKLARYDIDSMNLVLYIIGIIGIVKVISLFLSGAFSSANIDATEGLMGRGLTGHLLLLSYSIIPIVFLNWTYHHRLKYLISILMIMVVTFSSLIKYNIVGIFVASFIFILIYKKSVLKKAILVLLSSVVAVFFGNYMLTFYINGVLSNVAFTFYLGHLWTYISGSVIYDNYIFTQGIRVGVSIGYKLLTFLFALPNMFLNRLFSLTLFTHVKQGHLTISTIGERSNVVDAIGYIFPSKGDVVDLVAFALVMLGVGLLYSYIYRTGIREKGKYNTFLANFLCYFVFFSFFGTFYINSAPWEILVYSAIVPNLFYGRKMKFRWKRK